MPLPSSSVLIKSITNLLHSLHDKLALRNISFWKKVSFKLLNTSKFCLHPLLHLPYFFLDIVFFMFIRGSFSVLILRVLYIYIFQQKRSWWESWTSSTSALTLIMSCLCKWLLFLDQLMLRKAKMLNNSFSTICKLIFQDLQFQSENFANQETVWYCQILCFYHELSNTCSEVKAFVLTSTRPNSLFAVLPFFWSPRFLKHEIVNETWLLFLMLVLQTQCLRRNPNDKSK